MKNKGKNSSVKEIGNICRKGAVCHKKLGSQYKYHEKVGLKKIFAKRDS